MISSSQRRESNSVFDILRPKKQPYNHLPGRPRTGSSTPLGFPPATHFPAAATRASSQLEDVDERTGLVRTDALEPATNRAAAENADGVQSTVRSGGGGTARRGAAVRLQAYVRGYFARSRKDSYELQHDTLVPVRRVVADLRWWAGLKSLLAFTVFYSSYVSLSTLRMDWWQGHQTLEWLAEAHKAAGVAPLADLHSIGEVAHYFDHSLARVVDQLNGICPSCDVAITPKSTDLAFLGLEDFVCSDFDSVGGSNDYPTRNCSLEDSRWALAPSSTSAPCCRNETLVQASMGMMTEALAYGITTLPLSKLLAGGTDPSYSSTEFFLQYYIEHHHFLLQLIVSRRQRMAANSFKSRGTTADAPQRVQPSPAFWSFNYAGEAFEARLRLLMVVSGLIVFVHDQRYLLTFGASKWRGNCRPYTLAVELPSVALPTLLEILRPSMQLPDWTLAITISEMVMLVRLLHEGALIPPLRRLVRIIDEATPNVLALVVVLIPISILTAIMHSQSFGLFDEGFSDPFIALTRVVRMLTTPPPRSNAEGSEMEAVGAGSQLMYYWSTLVMRLCFGSFIVAILVGAYNKVVGQEQTENNDAARDASLPQGFVDAGDRPLWLRGPLFVRYLLTGYNYGDAQPRLVRALVRHVQLVELADDSGNAQWRQVMLGEVALAELVGDRPARELVRAYATRRQDARELYTC